jgi:hypothetical protein
MEMKDDAHETIIIGAGIAGLACARKLHENNKEFLVISEDVGGCILTSEDGKVNYGCYAVTEDHFHTKRLVKKGRMMSHSHILYHKGSESYQLFDKRNLTFLPQWVRFLLLIRKFRKHYAVFHKRCESVSQAQALRSDPFLFKLYNQTAEEFIRQHRIDKIVENYWSLISFACLFTRPNGIRAFPFLHLAILMTVPTFEFTYPQAEMTKGFEKKVVIGTATQITKKKDRYLIKTKKRNFWAKNVVVATPPNVSAKLLHLKEINRPANVHMFHVSGETNGLMGYCHVNFFTVDGGIFAIYCQVDGSYLVCSVKANPDFKKHFKRFKIINHKSWSPALHPGGHILWECEQDENLYLVGDHNLCSLEDAYVTGLYAASRIINSK